MSYSPVYQVQFILQNAPQTSSGSGPGLGGLEISALEFDYGTAKFDLTLASGETPDGLVTEFEYSTDLFDADTIERMLDRLENLIRSLVADPTQHIDDVPLLTDTEANLTLALHHPQFNP